VASRARVLNNFDLYGNGTPDALEFFLAAGNPPFTPPIAGLFLDVTTI